MPIEYRDWYRNWFFRGQHPPTCSCSECIRKRLGKPSGNQHNPSENLLPSEQKCPICGKRLYYDSGALLWRCKNHDCMRLYTHKDLFPEEIGTAKEERQRISAERLSEETQTPPKAERRSALDAQPAGDGEKTVQPSTEPKNKDEVKHAAKVIKRESMDEFISKLLYRKNSWDVSIMDLLVVSLAIFVVLMLYIIFLR